MILHFDLNKRIHIPLSRQVFDQMITDFEWKSFGVLYESIDSLIRTHRLLERWDARGHTIFLYHLGSGPSYRSVHVISIHQRSINLHSSKEEKWVNRTASNLAQGGDAGDEGRRNREFYHRLFRRAARWGAEAGAASRYYVRQEQDHSDFSGNSSLINILR